MKATHIKKYKVMSTRAQHLLRGHLGRHLRLLGGRYGAALAYLTLATSYLTFAPFGSIKAFYASVVLFGLSAWSLPGIMAATAGDYVGPRPAPAASDLLPCFSG